MFGLKVPIVSIVIGEGGSGGALAIGCANKLLMLENAVFYVARYFNGFFFPSFFFTPFIPESECLCKFTFGHLLGLSCLVEKMGLISSCRNYHSCIL